MVRTLAILVLLALSFGAARAQDIGVIKGRDGCPVNSSELIWAMDNEDTHAASSIAGWVGATTLDAARNLKMRFCRVPAAGFANAPGPFAVLAIGSCPAGTWTIKRKLDAEDNNNVSQFLPTANAWLPSFLGTALPYDKGDATLHLCVYQGVSGGSFPDLRREYGVFTDQWQLPGALEYGEVSSDDSDLLKAIGGGWYNFNEWTWPSNWAQFAPRPHPYTNVSCCWAGVTEDPQLSFVRGWEDTTFSIARVGNTAPKPQAVCTASPSTGTDSIYTAFDGRQSFARGGKYLVAYEWTFPAGSTSNSPGPHYMSYVVGPGTAQEFVATLKVTDNEGDVSYASCSVIVYSSVQCPGNHCEIE